MSAGSGFSVGQGIETGKGRGRAPRVRPLNWRAFGWLGRANDLGRQGISEDASSGVLRLAQLAGAAGSYSCGVKTGSRLRPSRSPMTVASYAFDDSDALTAAGVPVRIPAGVHLVERRSLVFRVRLGGREVDLTLAEFDRLQSTGLVTAVSDPAATS